jgi:hypothetical protein
VSELTWDSDFERINRHRALAELVIHNRNWLPWWVICPVLDDFSDQGERYLRGEGLPPLPVRLWWAYRHWKFKRRHRSRIAAISGPINPMQVSNITGDRFTPASVIPLAPGQRIEYIPVRAEDHHHEISVMDMKSGKRRTVRVTDQMLNDVGHHLWDRLLPELDPEMRRAVWQGSDGEEDEIDATTVTDLKRRSIKAKFPARPTDLGSFPRPNCPKCHTPSPELGTPLDPDSPSGWGDSFFTCSNYKCRHSIGSGRRSSRSSKRIRTRKAPSPAHWSKGTERPVPPVRQGWGDHRAGQRGGAQDRQRRWHLDHDARAAGQIAGDHSGGAMNTITFATSTVFR